MKTTPKLSMLLMSLFLIAMFAFPFIIESANAEPGPGDRIRSRDSKLVLEGQKSDQVAGLWIHPATPKGEWAKQFGTIYFTKDTGAVLAIGDYRNHDIKDGHNLAFYCDAQGVPHMQVSKPGKAPLHVDLYQFAERMQALKIPKPMPDFKQNEDDVKKYGYPLRGMTSEEMKAIDPRYRDDGKEKK